MNFIRRIYPSLITNVETNHPVAALTFDDGPHPVYTPRVLRILEKYGASATFFMVGKAATRHPELVKMVAERGHVIGNHSWDHPNLTVQRSRVSRLLQMRACVNATAPYNKRLFRPPYGAQNDQIRLDALLYGHKIIMWNVSAQDWVQQDAGEIAKKMIDRITPGSIFLLHDAIYKGKVQETQFEREPMIKGLELALSELNKKLSFVTIPDLLKAGHPVSNWPLN